MGAAWARHAMCESALKQHEEDRHDFYWRIKIIRMFETRE
jgi:hypothetical protein